MPSKTAAATLPLMLPVSAAGAVAVLVLALSGGSALAEATTSFSTRQLMNACAVESGGEAGSAEFCNGFIFGTGLFYLELVRTEKIEPWACADPAPPVNRLRQDFVAWAQENSNRLDEPALDGFWRAMVETYPCDSQ